jgi:hypothetical protein
MEGTDVGINVLWTLSMCGEEWMALGFEGFTSGQTSFEGFHIVSLRRKQENCRSYRESNPFAMPTELSRLSYIGRQMKRKIKKQIAT